MKIVYSQLLFNQPTSNGQNKIGYMWKTLEIVAAGQLHAGGEPMLQLVLHSSAASSWVCQCYRGNNEHPILMLSMRPAFSHLPLQFAE